MANFGGFEAYFHLCGEENTVAFNTIYLRTQGNMGTSLLERSEPCKNLSTLSTDYILQKLTFLKHEINETTQRRSDNTKIKGICGGHRG